ncbi:hypothetical protein KQX54_013622 [Cotesia glomerata]|uniref:Uncharacterized protein n=1 Tax=Cotesia glomerata TaxID=32391 RepID=A0AAV7IH69_COTGL|nr:hypothetical protein KQX54_013622 [Cotesia glomerata]
MLFFVLFNFLFSRKRRRDESAAEEMSSINHQDPQEMATQSEIADEELEEMIEEYYLHDDSEEPSQTDDLDISTNAMVISDNLINIIDNQVHSVTTEKEGDREFRLLESSKLDKSRNKTKTLHDSDISLYSSATSSLESSSQVYSVAPEEGRNREFRLPESSKLDKSCDRSKTLHDSNLSLYYSATSSLETSSQAYSVVPEEGGNQEFRLLGSSKLDKSNTNDDNDDEHGSIISDDRFTGSNVFDLEDVSSEASEVSMSQESKASGVSQIDNLREQTLSGESEVSNFSDLKISPHNESSFASANSEFGTVDESETDSVFAKDR